MAQDYFGRQARYRNKSAFPVRETASTMSMPGNDSNVIPFSSAAQPDNSRIDEEDNSIEIVNPDGTAVVIFNPQPQPSGIDSGHYENLAEKLSEATLSMIASDLMQGIESDDQSRAEWKNIRAVGLDLLGLKVEKPRADIGGSGAPLEGMSNVRHPLLLEACLRFQANAMAELLPAGGPVKVKNDGLGNAQNDQDADQLEEDLNRYLTSNDGAPEYYPDTDRMLFGVGFSGMGFKKVYHCPIRRRPVSESVDAADVIVSNDATDIRNAGRITHRIKMRPAIMKRMQFVGAYRDIELSQPYADTDRIEQKVGKIQGIDAQQQRPKDNEYIVDECYTDYDIPGFEHKEKGRVTGLPLPYKITIERTSRKILEIRRNWNEDDEDFQARRVLIPYQFVPMFGFYASGLLQILGNTTTAITGAWRMMLDAGMFASFPGFLYAFNGDRQQDLNLRVPPGGGAGVDLNGASDIRSAVMPLPYRDPGPGLMTLVDNIAQTGQRVGGTAEIQVGEGRQDVPVGSTIALLEQAAKVLDAVHKRLHAAVSQELQVLLELFREDPESLFRFLKKDGRWTLESLTQALNNYALTPVSDPNTPTHIHRLMKLMALGQLVKEDPDLYNIKAVHERILRGMKIDDPESLFKTPEQVAQEGQQQPQDPAAVIAQATSQAKMAETQSRERISQQTSQLKMLDIQAKDKRQAEQNKIKAAELVSRSKQQKQALDSRERIEKLKLAERVALHPSQNPSPNRASQ
jgi:hypothetical protein